MLGKLWQALGNKKRQVWFYIVHGRKLGYCGVKSYAISPCRLDGPQNIKLGATVFFQRGLWLYAHGIEGIPAELIIGDNCVFGYNNHVSCVRRVEIGSAVLTANNVFIGDNYHDYHDIGLPIMQQPVRFKKAVQIGEGSWLGENVCIIAASVGKNCVIAANSVVTKDIPDFCVAAGAPARIVKRFDVKNTRWVNMDKTESGALDG